MITLTRRINESVLIDGEIRVTVVHLKNHRVRLQIEAPSNVSIRRERLEFDDQDLADATPPIDNVTATTPLQVNAPVFLSEHEWYTLDSHGHRERQSARKPPNPRR